MQKHNRDVELVNALQKIQTLEKLCRALQEERAGMQKRLKEKEKSPDDFVNVEIPTSESNENNCQN